MAQSIQSHIRIQQLGVVKDYWNLKSIGGSHTDIVFITIKGEVSHFVMKLLSPSQWGFWNTTKWLPSFCTKIPTSCFLEMWYVLHFVDRFHCYQLCPPRKTLNQGTEATAYTCVYRKWPSRLGSHMSGCSLQSRVWCSFVPQFRCKFLLEFAPKPKIALDPFQKKDRSRPGHVWTGYIESQSGFTCYANQMQLKTHLFCTYVNWGQYLNSCILSPRAISLAGSHRHDIHCKNWRESRAESEFYLPSPLNLRAVAYVLITLLIDLLSIYRCISWWSGSPRETSRSTIYDQVNLVLIVLLWSLY